MPLWDHVHDLPLLNFQMQSSTIRQGCCSVRMQKKSIVYVNIITIIYLYCEEGSAHLMSIIGNMRILQLPSVQSVSVM